MPRSSRRISRTLARPSRSSDLACASRRRVSGRVSIRSRLAGKTDCLPAGRTLLAGALDRRNAMPAGPLSPCVFASYPDAGVIRNVALGVSSAQRRTRITDVVLLCHPTRSTAIPCTFPSPRCPAPGGTSPGPAPCPGRPTAGPSESIIRPSDRAGFSPAGSGPAACSIRNVSGDAENGYQTGRGR